MFSIYCENDGALFQTYESESIRSLAAYNFSQILKLCSQIPDVAREISSDYINVIFRQLLSSSIKVSLLNYFET